MSTVNNPHGTAEKLEVVLLHHSYPINKSTCSLELTNEMITHLVQHRLHVFTTQALGTHKALQHPKHATQSPLGSTAGTGDYGYT